MKPDLKTLEITDAMCDAIEAIGRAQRAVEVGQVSAAIVEIPKLALADAVLAAIRAQLVKAHAAGRMAQLRGVKRPQQPIVEVELRRKRKRSA